MSHRLRINRPIGRRLGARARSGAALSTASSTGRRARVAVYATVASDEALSGAGARVACGYAAVASGLVLQLLSCPLVRRLELG